MKRFFSVFLIITLFSLIFPVYGASDGDFVTVENGDFMLGGQRYTALGTCLYPAHNADYNYIHRTIRQAKANGITLIRAVDIWEGVYGNDDSALYSDSVWKRVDYIIKVCRDYDMKVLLDISTVRQFLFYSPNQRDSYDPATFPLWSEIIEFVCSRENSFTSVIYRDDPTIMAYSFAGEPVCYGGQLNDWSNGYFTSRSADDIEKSFFYIADRLRENDPNHLISSGGLLHISPKDPNGVEFYKAVWSYENIDFGSVHIYPAEGQGEGEWANLPTHNDYCKSISKPLMMEEFGDGGADREYKAQYMSDCFAKCRENDLSVVIFWNWSIGASFDTYPHMTEMMDVLHENARHLGFTDEFLPLENPVVEGETILSFEDSNTMFTPNTTDPAYNGQFYVADEIASDGSKSLCVPVDFDTTYEWYWSNCPFAEPLTLNGEYLAADIYIPEDATPLYAKFSVNGVQQADSGKTNNFILPGQWNTVYLALGKDIITSPEGNGFAPDTAPDLTSVNSIGLLLLNTNGTYTGNVYIDNLRTGTLSLFEEETFTELKISGVQIDSNTITVDASGGYGKLSYSYYVLADGEVLYSKAFTDKNSVTVENLAADNYSLRVYVQDGKKTRVVYSVVY